MSKTILALVLVDVVAHQLKAGTLLEADKGLVDALAKSGEVDPHKDAVAAGKAAGLPVARSCIELAAEQRDAARQALLVEVGKLEQALASAADDAVKQALEAELASNRAALKDLDA